MNVVRLNPADRQPRSMADLNIRTVDEKFEDRTRTLDSRVRLLEMNANAQPRRTRAGSESTKDILEHVGRMIDCAERKIVHRLERLEGFRKTNFRRMFELESENRSLSRQLNELKARVL